MECRRKLFVGLALVLVCVLSFGGTLGAVGMYRSSTLPKAYYFCDSVPSIRPAAFEQEFSLEYTVQYEFGFAMSPSDLSARLLNGFFSEQPDYAVCIFEFVRIQPDGDDLIALFRSLHTSGVKVVFYSRWSRDSYKDEFFEFVDEFQLVRHEDPMKNFARSIATIPVPGDNTTALYGENSFVLIDRRFVGDFNPNNFNLTEVCSYPSFMQYFVRGLMDPQYSDDTWLDEDTFARKLNGLRSSKVHLMLYVYGTYYFDMLNPEAGLVSLTNFEDMAGMDEGLDSDRIHACGITLSPLESGCARSFAAIRHMEKLEGTNRPLPVYLLEADDRQNVIYDSDGSVLVLTVITGGTLDPAFQDILEDDEAAMLQSLRAFLERRT